MWKLNLSFSPTFMLGFSGTKDEVATILMVSLCGTIPNHTFDKQHILLSPLVRIPLV
jgi:hypothetical protein